MREGWKKVGRARTLAAPIFNMEHIGELVGSGGVLDPLMQIGLKPNNADS